MFGWTKDVYHTCPEIGQKVKLNQTGGQCRSQNGCEQKCCPLEYNFMPEPIDMQLTTMRLKMTGH